MVRTTARSATGAVAVGVAAGVIGLGLVLPAAADPPSSTLVANPTSVSLDIAGPTSAGVDVALDDGCLNAFGNQQGKAQTYGILGTSANTAVATVTSEVDGLHCAPAPPGHFTISTFAYPTSDPNTDPNYASEVAAACAAVGTTVVTFTPVAAPAGLSKKLAGTTVAVTVTNNTGKDCNGGGPQPPPAGGNPAAPAVANAYLNISSVVASACQKQFPGKAWRGNLISAIAHWMPLPESLKDDPTLFPGNDWVTYVQSEVDVACKDGLSQGYFPPNDPRIPGFTTLN